MAIKGSKGHVGGKKVSGRHSSVIEMADNILKKLAKAEWLESVRPMEIKPARGGRPAITIKRHPDTNFKHTLRLTFRQSGSVQDVDVKLVDLQMQREQAIEEIRTIANKLSNGLTVYDKSQ